MPRSGSHTRCVHVRRLDRHNRRRWLGHGWPCGCTVRHAARSAGIAAGHIRQWIRDARTAAAGLQRQQADLDLTRRWLRTRWCNAGRADHHRRPIIWTVDGHLRDQPHQVVAAGRVLPGCAWPDSQRLLDERGAGCLDCCAPTAGHRWRDRYLRSRRRSTPGHPERSRIRCLGAQGV